MAELGEHGRRAVSVLGISDGALGRFEDGGGDGSAARSGTIALVLAVQAVAEALLEVADAERAPAGGLVLVDPSDPDALEALVRGAGFEEELGHRLERGPVT